MRRFFTLIFLLYTLQSNALGFDFNFSNEAPLTYEQRSKAQKYTYVFVAGRSLSATPLPDPGYYLLQI